VRGCAPEAQADGLPTRPQPRQCAWSEWRHRAIYQGFRLDAKLPATPFCGRSSMVELQPSKLVMRFRLPSPALVKCLLRGGEQSLAGARLAWHCN
jgi:hypothetical protein